MTTITKLNVRVTARRTSLPVLILPDLSWHEAANCRRVPNEQMMPYPPPIGNVDKYRRFAEEVCRGCPVYGECLTTFLDYGGYGVWAGEFRSIRCIYHRKVKGIRHRAVKKLIRR